jgi:nicotinamidase/pyrazinamidase
MMTIFFDVDNQLDFLYPAGSLYVPGAEDLLPALGRLTQYAKDHQIQILSTADAHEENDPEFEDWPPHCIIGTVGQQKSAVTLAVPRPSILKSLSRATAAPNLQIIVEKQHTDCFTNPNLGPLLASLRADRYVVYGVVSEICVASAAMGLLDTGARVELVTDAIRHLDAFACDAMLSDFTSEGGVLTTADAVIGDKT